MATARKPADKEVLPPFEGSAVVEARAVVRNAGDGLSEALHFEPFTIHQGDRRYLVLDVTCIDVQHPYADRKNPDGGLARVHILRAETGLFMDAEFIAEAVEKQRELIRVAREEESGIQRFTVVEEEEE